jgi:MFS family permease
MRRRPIAFLNVSMFFSMLQYCLSLISEPMLMQDAAGGDVAATAAALGLTTAASALVGVVVNQAGGQASDTVGRKWFLLAGPAACILTNLMVLKFPAHLPIILVCRVARTALTGLSSTVMVTASLSDIYSGTELAVASSKLMRTVGIGLITAQWLEATMLERWGKPTVAFGASLVSSVLHLLCNWFFIPETLPQSHRSTSMSLRAINPFGFLRVFTRGSRPLRKLVVITAIQCSEYAVMH